MFPDVIRKKSLDPEMLTEVGTWSWSVWHYYHLVVLFPPTLFIRRMSGEHCGDWPGHVHLYLVLALVPCLVRDEPVGKVQGDAGSVEY